MAPVCSETKRRGAQPVKPTEVHDLEKQPRHVVIEVPVFRTRPVRKYVVVDLTVDDIPEIN